MAERTGATMFSDDETLRIKLTAELNRLNSPNGPITGNYNRMKYEQGLAEQAWNDETKGGKEGKAYKEARARYLAAKAEYNKSVADAKRVEAQVKEVEARIADSKSLAQKKETAAETEANNAKKAEQLRNDIEYKKSMGMDYGVEQKQLDALAPKATVKQIPLGEGNKFGPTVPGVTPSASAVAGPTVAAAANVGKGPWQQNLQTPAFVYPTGYTVGDAVYMGAEAWQKGSAPLLKYGDQYATKEAAADVLYTMGKQERADLVKMADTLGISVESAWNTAIDASAANLRMGTKLSPLAALQKYINDGIKSGALTGGSGGAGTSVTQTSYNLSSESDARLLVNNALQQHLGRAATKQEEANFYAALTKTQKANPTVTHQSGSTAITSTTKGGLNASQFADEFGSAQQGAGEHAAATTYLDAFLGSLMNPVNVAGV